jgi:hypothetical protein
MLWIRIQIRMGPHHFGNLDPYQSDKLDPELDPDPQQLQMTSHNVCN